MEDENDYFTRMRVSLLLPSSLSRLEGGHFGRTICAERLYIPIHLAMIEFLERDDWDELKLKPDTDNENWMMK